MGTLGGLTYLYLIYIQNTLVELFRVWIIGGGWVKKKGKEKKESKQRNRVINHLSRIPDEALLSLHDSQ